MPLLSQRSLEARWRDVEGFINNEVQNDDYVMKTEDNDTMEQNSTSPTDELNFLLQDASLGTIEPQDTSFNFTQPAG